MNTPYDYQLDAAEKLVQQTCSLLDADMGTGKTIISLVALAKLKYPRTLVVCPAVAVTNWKHEASKWGVPNDTLTVISYDKMRQPKVKEELLAKQFAILILDEAHYLKNPESKRTQAIYGETKQQHLGKQEIVTDSKKYLGVNIKLSKKKIEVDDRWDDQNGETEVEVKVLTSSHS